jgi:hypothetical protein
MPAPYKKISISFTNFLTIHNKTTFLNEFPALCAPIPFLFLSHMLSLSLWERVEVREISGEKASV